MKFIVTFNDVTGSLRTEQVLQYSPYPRVIDAAPRRLGASCIYIIRTEAPSSEEIAAVLKNAGIVWKDILEEDAP